MKSFKECKQRIENDSEFAKKFESAQSFEEAIEIAKAEGYEITEEDLKEGVQLTEDQLSAVSGGKNDKIKAKGDIKVIETIGVGSDNKTEVDF